LGSPFGRDLREDVEEGASEGRAPLTVWFVKPEVGVRQGVVTLTEQVANCSRNQQLATCEKE
jgi:hypothetical protein